MRSAILARRRLRSWRVKVHSNGWAICRYARRRPWTGSARSPRSRNSTSAGARSPASPTALETETRQAREPRDLTWRLSAGTAKLLVAGELNVTGRSLLLKFGKVPSILTITPPTTRTPLTPSAPRPPQAMIQHRSSRLADDTHFAAPLPTRRSAHRTTVVAWSGRLARLGSNAESGHAHRRHCAGVLAPQEQSAATAPGDARAPAENRAFMASHDRIHSPAARKQTIRLATSTRTRASGVAAA